MIEPCPFCGGEARLTIWRSGFWVVADHKGGCILNDMEPPKHGWYVTKEAAIKAWNRRGQ